MSLNLSESSVQRIRAAYIKAHALDNGPVSSEWETIIGFNKEFYDRLLQGLPVDDDLRNPAGNNLFYGFDSLHIKGVKDQKNPGALEAYQGHLFKQLVILADMVGAKRVWNPEQQPKPKDMDVEDLLAAIESKICCPLTFPNPFPHENGLVTSRGVISYRAIHAVYQAWRLKTLCDNGGEVVVEIGAGLGRTAYQFIKMTNSPYTIIDLPETNVSQANFLMRTLGADKISLYREPINFVNILPTLCSDCYSDVLLNVDSLTEMPLEVMESYAECFVKHGRVFLSINHEANEHTVAGLSALRGKCVGRFQYALREGYVEEVFVA